MEDFFSNQLIHRFEQMLEKNEYTFFDADEFVEIIEYYIDITDFEFAKKALNISFDQYPENLQLKIKKLEFLIATKSLSLAAGLIEELQPHAMQDTDYLLATGMYWSLKKQPKKSIEFYLLALENKDELDFIHNSLGNEFLELKDTFKALHHFKKSLLFNPKDEYAFFSCIHCYEELHKNKDCIQFLLHYIDEQPYSEAAWFQLGLKYIQVKNYTEAYQSFDFANAINPKSIVNYIQKGYCLEKMQYFTEAIIIYTEAIAYDDSAAYIYQKIARCYTHLNEPFKALKVYLQAIKEDPQLDVLWYEAGKIYEQIGNTADALYYVSKALKLDETNTIYLKKLTYLHIKNSMFEEAIIDFKKLIQIEPYNFNNHFAFSELLISIGEVNTAITLLETSIAKFNKAELHYQLSHCYFFSNQVKAGTKHLLIAYESNPNLIDEMTEKYPILKENAEKHLGR